MIVRSLPIDLSQTELGIRARLNFAGIATLVQNDVVYRLVKNTGEGVGIVVYEKDKLAGTGGTDENEPHDAIEIYPSFRGKGYATTVLRLIEITVGRLEMDWSSMCSRLYFLLKRGYVPTHCIIDFSDEGFYDTERDREIDKGTMERLISRLKEFKQCGGREDYMADTFRLRYLPERAQTFLRENNL